MRKPCLYIVTTLKSLHVFDRWLARPPATFLITSLAEVPFSPTRPRTLYRVRGKEGRVFIFMFIKTSVGVRDERGTFQKVRRP